MSTARVLHVPSHMTYVRALDDASEASSMARLNLRIADLLAEPSWDFDVIHLHSLELVTLADLIRLRSRTIEEGARLVATIHDLVPNIEASTADFRTKVAYVATVADHVFTLTPQASEQIAALAPGARKPEVTPHGAAVAIDAIPRDTIGGGDGLALFGAFRPYREIEVVVKAWQRLGHHRPKMRILLRSVTQADHERDGDLLDFLEGVARTDSRLSLTVAHSMLDDEHLIRWLAGASALVLPYSHITHSGQLELARDIGLPVIAPNEPTLRGQLDTGPRTDLPVDWFQPAALTIDDFTAVLRHACELASDTANRARSMVGRNQDSIRASRRDERAAITTQHAKVYRRLTASTRQRV